MLPNPYRPVCWAVHRKVPYLHNTPSCLMGSTEMSHNRREVNTNSYYWIRKLCLNSVLYLWKQIVLHQAFCISIVWCVRVLWFRIVSVSHATIWGINVTQGSISQRDSTCVQIHKANIPLVQGTPSIDSRLGYLLQVENGVFIEMHTNDSIENISNVVILELVPHM